MLIPPGDGMKDCIGMEPMPKCVWDANSADEKAQSLKVRVTKPNAEKGAAAMIRSRVIRAALGSHVGASRVGMRITAVQHAFRRRISEASDPVRPGQARIRRRGEMPAPLRGPPGDSQ